MTTKTTAREGKAKLTCSVCGLDYRGFGNNAWPLNDGRCCDVCNALDVIPARIAMMTTAGGRGT